MGTSPQGGAGAALSAVHYGGMPRVSRGVGVCLIVFSVHFIVTCIPDQFKSEMYSVTIGSCNTFDNRQGFQFSVSADNTLICTTRALRKRSCVRLRQTELLFCGWPSPTWPWVASASLAQSAMSYRPYHITSPSHIKCYNFLY